MFRSCRFPYIKLSGQPSRTLWVPLTSGPGYEAERGGKGQVLIEATKDLRTMAGERRRGTRGCGVGIFGIFLMTIGLGLVEGRASTLVMNKDSRAAYLVEPFCFSPGGTVNFNVCNPVPC